MRTAKAFAVSLGIIAAIGVFDRRYAQIAGARRSSPGQFTHVARIQTPDNEFCTGVLIAERAMLTAQHCVQNHPTSLIVTTADWSNNLSGRVCRQRANRDLAVITLDRAPRRTNAMLAETVDGALIDSSRTVTIVGFGHTANPQNVGNGLS